MEFPLEQEVAEVDQAVAAVVWDFLAEQHAERGEVLVDAWNRTTVPSIYAVGDVTGGVKDELEAATRLMQVYLGLKA